MCSSGLVLSGNGSVVTIAIGEPGSRIVGSSTNEEFIALADDCQSSRHRPDTFAATRSPQSGCRDLNRSGESVRCRRATASQGEVLPDSTGAGGSILAKTAARREGLNEQCQR